MSGHLRYTVIALAGCLLFLPFLGHVHLFDWDEINFAECAREMIVSKDYLRSQIDFMPFWEKPPFFIWMQAISMKMFGVGEYAARFPNAVIGVLTLLTVFYIGKRVVSEKIAIWWTLLYAASWLPHFYFKTGIIDPTFNFFIFIAFFQFHLLRVSGRKLLHAFLSGLFLGIAVLTKGPVAILVAGLSLVTYMAFNRGLNGYKIGHLLMIGLVALLPMLLWLGAAVVFYGQAYGRWFIEQFLWYQVRLFRTEDADHGGPFFYHFIVLLIGCFPASVFLLQYTRKRVTGHATAHDFTRLMWILFWVVLILFSIVKTKIVHYSSLCYFPLTYLAALQLHRLVHEPYRMKGWVKGIMLFTGTVWAIILIALPVVGINKTQLIPYIHDKFVVANLAANVHWSYAECAWGIAYLAGIWITILMMSRDLRRGMLLLCAIQVVIIQVTVLHFTPKIEQYTQASSIAYFESFKGKDVYVQPLAYKSYGNLFYTDKRPSTDSQYVDYRRDDSKTLQPVANIAWLVHGRIDKPAFFICKSTEADNIRKLAELEETGGANGFVFFRRRMEQVQK